MTTAERTVVHGTAVAISGRAVLLVGPSGCGKSDLALRLIDAGWRLVADDAVQLSAATGAQSGRIEASALPHAHGRLMVRGIGIVRVAACKGAVPLALAIDLSGHGSATDAFPFATLGHIEPMPGRSLPLVTLSSFDASSVRKVALALERWGF